ncbi:sensor histidine kinase [Agromyces sp. SYSU K20354]|uniref:sensor histidine kinase n=1 Tax=Agromyces cavernae TaxID=2898659 RepID=UPI001E50C07A|nr:sensor histidine kinase [Agromyces cavernae]MCD2443005.1 sensor histidine kinase [Agromyces cavernae]
MTRLVRSLWNAPAAASPPPRRVWRDWVLVAVIPPLVLFEAAVRPDVPWRWLWAAVLIGLVPTLLWRRTRPLLMLAIAFAVGWVGSAATGGDPQLVTTAYFLILVYAVFRWGDGRAFVGGAALLVASSAVSFVLGSTTVGDVIGGLGVLVATVALGVAFRWRAGARARELDRVKLVEREQLARDLHDTVAHHVSAIAIQAQAGTAVAATSPDAAAAALRTIELEASRTLAEMRSIVRVLRNDDAAERTPGPGIADLRALARAEPGSPIVDVRVEGDVDAVPPTIAAALYRLAQEAVTNARRHARNATRVDVHVRVDAADIRLDVDDDGEPATSATPGFGITGMRERATLLGGTFRAGPAAGGGWSVTAVIPRTGWPT